MSAHNRRPSFSSSTTSSLAKRQASSASSSDNVGKVLAVPPHLAKKRAPLGNLTNFKNVSHSAAKSSGPPPIMVLAYFILALDYFVVWFLFISLDFCFLMGLNFVGLYIFLFQ